jgi:hypothetical protein
MRVVLGIFLFLALISPSAFASDEIIDSFYEGNAMGSAGWNYGYDDEDDGEARRREQERLEKERLEKEAKKRKNNDFFSYGVGVYDKQVSRTDKQEKKAHGADLIEK